MKTIIKRHALVSYYGVTLIFSIVIIAFLFVTGLAESLFFLGTFAPGLAAILVTALISSEAGVRKLLGMSFPTCLIGLLALSVLYTCVFNNTRASIWSAVFFHWMYTYALDTMGAGLAPPPTEYQILQYVPYIIIAVVVTAVWGTKTLTRERVPAAAITPGEYYDQ